MRPKLVVDYLVYVTVRLFICAVQATPLSVCAQVSKFLAWLANDIFKIRGKLLDSNLKQLRQC